MRAPVHTAAGVALVALLFASAAFASGPVSASGRVEWGQLGMGLIGGLALFLYGMELMGSALKAATGDRMRGVLGALSNNRIIGMLTGAVVTAVIQSSSVTTVMLVGFVSANLMSLSQSIGVILGADIGTTITAQIVAFKVTKYALLLVGVGFFVLFVAKREDIKQYGAMVLGLGLIFFGMSVMSDSMKPLRSFQPFLSLMRDMSHPVMGIVAAAVFTALVQSSSATMGVVIVLASQGLIDLQAGVALALGANIGTCVTAGLAAIGKPREAVRVAVAHVLFKVLGVLLVLPFLESFLELARLVSPGAPAGLSGQALAASVVPRQVANAHTMFNVGIAFLFIPFTGVFARIITRLVPDRPLSEEAALIEVEYLDELLLKTPVLALDAARLELGRLGKLAVRMFEAATPAVLSGTEEDLAAVEAQDERIDALYARIIEFLGETSRRSLSKSQTAELTALMSVANDLENIGDIIETDLVSLGRNRIQLGFEMSAETQQSMLEIHEVVLTALRSAVHAATVLRPELAQQVVDMKAHMNAIVAAAEAHHAQRLVADEPHRLKAYSVEIDIVDKLRRVFYHAKRISKTLA